MQTRPQRLPPGASSRLSARARRSFSYPPEYRHHATEPVAAFAAQTSPKRSLTTPHHAAYHFGYELGRVVAHSSDGRCRKTRRRRHVVVAVLQFWSNAASQHLTPRSIQHLRGLRSLRDAGPTRRRWRLALRV